ncbi:hypothetical protein [Actibacterium sp. MT2.3-13A]|uniref:hypothetical protein n=1 Tax=Actibacterium sp. MT2.3-13A TaxID=2828332 RepID=UPI001BA77BE3|nr:hypothetical protein [Actibacterium sp. MT2.3-13A]
MTQTHDRRAQKARTREAILEGARALIARGESVTVTAAAAESGISKATAYRYYSDPAALALEAGLALEVKPYAEVVAGASGAREKVRAVSLYTLDLALAHEAAFRRFLARVLDASVADRRPGTLRGARRIAMFEAALEEARPALGAEATRELVLALATATGIEAVIALRDVAGADADRARATVLAIADALLDRYLGPA